MTTKLRQITGTDGGSVAYWCQGCDSTHVINVGPREDGRPKWDWDGNRDAPTFSPSVLVTYKDLSDEGEDERCHTFIRGGMVEFLSDCTHQFAGQTLPLPDWPYPDGEYGGVEPLRPPDPG